MSSCTATVFHLAEQGTLLGVFITYRAGLWLIQER
jgi:hypothetical protein